MYCVWVVCSSPNVCECHISGYQAISRMNRWTNESSVTPSDHWASLFTHVQHIQQNRAMNEKHLLHVVASVKVQAHSPSLLNGLIACNAQQQWTMMVAVNMQLIIWSDDNYPPINNESIYLMYFKSKHEAFIHIIIIDQWWQHVEWTSSGWQFDRRSHHDEWEQHQHWCITYHNLSTARYCCTYT